MRNKQLLTLLFLSLGLFLGSWGGLELVASSVQAAPPDQSTLPPNDGCLASLTTCQPIKSAGRMSAASHPLQFQITKTLTPSKDNTLIEDVNGSLSNGAGQNFFVGRTGQPSGSIRRGLIAFDLTNSDIPSGSTIISVTLRLHMLQTVTDSQPITLYRLLADWGEAGSVAGGGQGAPAQPGDATWTHAITNTTPWTTPGGDFSPISSASRLVGGAGFYEWGSTPQMVADVQTWFDMPSGNFGWLLQGNESSAGTAKSFDSKETLIEANRPVLIIEFELPIQVTYLPMILN